MADNWSSSVVTLADKGDWIKWDFTIPDTATADDLNGDPSFVRLFMAIRLALTAASRAADIVVLVNDLIAFHMSGGVANSSSSWVSDRRFWFSEESVSPGFETTDASRLQSPLTVTGLTPFVVGTNTIRLLSLGRDSDGTAEPIEIDFLMLDTGDFPGVARLGAADGNDFTFESAPAGFAGHTNGDPFDSVPPTTDDHGWLLKAPDGTTGSAGLPTLRIVRFCPSGGGDITAILKFTDGASPVSGQAGVWDITTATAQTATLDGNGKAWFTFPDTSDVLFWYGGNDDWMPLAQRVDDGFRVGCNGWHVGRIGVG